ncbi:MAG: 3-phosphoshikimate 1-carboxyvinyltransferase [Bryobacterales bacterium]|nr:3-phosphoshikimate 1-carboxyvinyltransferase [Bryobacteraceae bacterium]MDW8353764.1 3-phosphoshikimate 1-carboxyvinyltransferase [Bryobacterales bacterium]
MTERIAPAARLRGTLRLPGDKSISHRYAILGALAEGETRIRNYATGADCRSTLQCLRALGTPVETEGDEVVIQGRGLRGLRPSAEALDAGNSGSTMRLLAGVLAGQPFLTRLTGDASLTHRPMDRIVRPLRLMGAHVAAREERFPPLEIRGGPLRAIEYELPVASAQVKSCVLLAGLYAEGRTAVIEPVRTRDHTEVALRQFGADVEIVGRRISVTGWPRLEGRHLEVPGDLSSAAFFIAAALILPESELVIEEVGLNPTRSALLDFLCSMGARIRILNLREQAGELVGDIQVRSSPLRGGVIEKAMTAALIDEIPVLAVLGALSEEGLTVRDAAELRVKESDRIATVAENLRRLGASIETSVDGFYVPGRQKLRGAALASFGDHRIAMAFSIAALAAEGDSLLEGAEAAAVSLPEFFRLLGGLTHSA